MRRAERGEAPALLERHGEEIGRDYARRRRAEPGYRFQWPRRGGESLLEVAYAGLVLMTGGHCAYCDGHPIDAMGEEQVDHFRPKSRPDFYELVCVWQNLFLVCTGCNKAKRDQWDEGLLRPDEEDFGFERYFEYRFDSGELHPNPAGDAAEQGRARRTIDIFQLNRAGACVNRRRAVRAILQATSPEERDDVAYRYLVPLCARS